MAGKVSAQIRATTASGNKVLLFPNGTWKYDEGQLVKDTLPNSATQSQTAVAPVVTTAPASWSMKIDSSRVDSTMKEQIIDVSSPRLARFFGEEKGRMRCSAECVNEKGVISIRLEWAAAVGDANRYFGFMRDLKDVTFLLANGQELKFQYNPGFKEHFFSNYNISYYNGSVTLTKNDIGSLLSSPVVRIDMDWKKAPEEYEVKGTQYFMNNLPKVL
ncbi:hypothetical protein PbJCM13498_35630 [Prolixibacter bellariivorans]|uniref:Uncharacterized protein n=2 Tax=Prolixibacter bellariivorans TaxID=314319 RepID=A0A5M4B3H9_9BACT|nr:hypothetical protein PbJCM13498_35630 [Prolixibacter bellariivorans]